MTDTTQIQLEMTTYDQLMLNQYFVLVTEINGGMDYRIARKISIETKSSIISASGLPMPPTYRWGYVLDGAIQNITMQLDDDGKDLKVGLVPDQQLGWHLMKRHHTAVYAPMLIKYFESNTVDLSKFTVRVSPGAVNDNAAWGLPLYVPQADPNVIWLATGKGSMISMQEIDYECPMMTSWEYYTLSV